MYLGLAYGQGMLNTDMVVFYATGQGVVDDLWSDDYKAPKHDF